MKPEQQPPAAERPADASRYRRLPDPVDLDDVVESHDTEPAPDPEGGRNTERDFMLRYGAG